jgi:hypothetical protein
LKETTFYTYKELTEMLNKEGFGINIKSSTTKHYNKPSELYEWILNNFSNTSLEQQDEILKDKNELV